MYPRAYIQYLVHFHGDRDYFECHEILEEHWKEKPAGKRHLHWVGFIQIAVSLYHHRRQNIHGAIRMMKSAVSILEKEKYAVQQLGLNFNSLLSLLQERIIEMENGYPYRSLNLPIADMKLEECCIKACARHGLTWKSNSDLTNTFLLNKHTLRDRTDIIAERMKQIEKRKQRP
jgi:predicted metal-dependent hydrolase